MSSISAVASAAAFSATPLSRNATSSSGVASAPIHMTPSVGWSDDVADVSFGFGQIHMSAAIDTSGLAQYHGGESNAIAATSEYIQQKVIYEAALTMVVQGSLSAPEANHLLKDGY